MRAEVKEYILKTPGKFTRKDIEIKFPRVSPRTIAYAFEDLLKDGKIFKLGHGLYSLDGSLKEEVKERVTKEPKVHPSLVQLIETIQIKVGIEVFREREKEDLLKKRTFFQHQLEAINSKLKEWET